MIARICTGLCVLLGLLFVHESISVSIDDTGYVWTTEGPFPWYYKTRMLYVLTAGVDALRFALSAWALWQVNMWRAGLVAVLLLVLPFTGLYRMGLVVLHNAIWL